MSLGTLVLLRHGQSEWNAKNLFTGWVDVGLTERARPRPGAAASCSRARLLPDVVHTSRAAPGDPHRRAGAGRRRPALDPGAPVLAAQRAALRRAAGQGQEQTLEEYGEEQFMLWRRSYDTPPPPIGRDDEYSQVGDPRYATCRRS